MKLKSFVLAAGLSMVATSSFALPVGYTAGFDLSPAGSLINDDQAPAAVYATISADTTDLSGVADNTALISQDGSANPNTAYIDQSGGAGNFAAILQDGTNNSNNAAIYQVGNANSATIYQH